MCVNYRLFEDKCLYTSIIVEKINICLYVTDNSLYLNYGFYTIFLYFFINNSVCKDKRLNL